MKLLYISKLCLLSLIAFCASGCFEKKEHEEYITIGVLLPLTGESSDEGLRALNGLQLAKQEINENGGILGKKLDIVIFNDKGDKHYALQRYEALKESGVVAMIGSSYSDVTMVLAQEAEKDGIPLISPTASNPLVTKDRKNVFRAIFTDNYQTEVMAKFARNSLKAKTVLIMHRNDSGYMQIADFFRKAFVAQGGEVIAFESYASESEYKSILGKHTEEPPDAIYCSEDYAPAAQLLNDILELGLNSSYMLGSDAWDGILDYVSNPEVRKKIYYTVPFAFDDQDYEVERFVRSYFTKFSQMPITGSASAYTSVYILSEAIKKAGSTNRDSLVLAMKENEFNSIMGRIKFDENNNPHPNVYVVKIKDGKYITYEKISHGGE
ncbi:MAG: ABC transporter substrate-binding protein [Fibromonadaceae bacterium]|jgi:branched-chain amino acid transport system substrate-binding protein|nr:ABC transporter substrate-binding protein [Fibromonadaceae bacterium]